MAEAQTPAKKAGVTRGKLILIAVLAVVLIVVLYAQFGSSGGAPASDPVGYHPPGRPAQATNAAATGAIAAATNVAGSPEVNVSPNIDPARWKSPELAAVIAHDPFALPPAFPQPPRVALEGKSGVAAELIAAATADDAKKLAEAVEKIRMELGELEQRGVHVIVREGDQYAAVIGDRMLHVGDEINGFTVTAIDPTGVRIERK